MRRNPVFKSDTYRNASAQELNMLGNQAILLARLNNLPFSNMMPNDFYTNFMRAFGTEYVFGAGKEGPYNDLDSILISYPIESLGDLATLLGMPEHIFPQPFEQDYLRSDTYRGMPLRDVILECMRNGNWQYLSLFASKPNKSMSSALLLRDFMDKSVQDSRNIISILSPDAYRVFTTFIRRYAETGKIEGDIVLDFPINFGNARFIMFTARQ